MVEPNRAGLGTSTTDVSLPSARGLQLLVLEPHGFTVHPLAGAGDVTIGRAEQCTVRLSDGLASRKHATLFTQDLTIRDEGSSNGTRLGGLPLEPGVAVPVPIGQVVQIGSTMLIIRRAASGTFPVVRSPIDVTPNIVIQDPAMTALYALLDRVAGGSINVLVLGETGVGKELVAEAVHRRSPRRGGPLVRINCATLAEPLLESELFGHERGAFTGAVGVKQGLLESADGGTVFLDEVGELTPGLQAKLLRVIETREVRRLGGLRARSIDLRFISATNRDLGQEAARGVFRTDLFFRLNGVSAHVPPLRDRRGEILPLAQVFLSRAAAQAQVFEPVLTPAAAGALLAHSWPGNVRELRNVIERAVLLCTEGAISERDLALEQPNAELRVEAEPIRPSTLPPAADGESGLRSSAKLDEAERERIAAALRACGGNQSRAATWLGMPRRTLVRRIAQLGLPRPRS